MELKHAIICILIIIATGIGISVIVNQTETAEYAKDIPKTEIEWKLEEDYLPQRQSSLEKSNEE